MAEKANEYLTGVNPEDPEHLVDVSSPGSGEKAATHVGSCDGACGGSRDDAKDDGKDADLKDGCVAAVSIKVPPFPERCPERWFTVIEAQFRLANIKNPRTKFDHILANVPYDVFEMLSLSCMDRESDPYGALKAAVLGRYSEPPEARMHAALTLQGENLQLVCQHLQALLDPAFVPDVQDSLIRELLLQHFSAEDRKVARPFLDQSLPDFARSLEGIRRAGAPVSAVELDDQEAEVFAVGRAKICKLHWQFGIGAYRCTCPRECAFGPQNCTPKEKQKQKKKKTGN